MSHNNPHLWIIAYDISDQKIRRHIYQTLKDYGTRIQYSVFECRLKPSQREILRAEILQHIEPDDTVRWYPQCTHCEDKIHWQGEGLETDKQDYFIL